MTSEGEQIKCHYDNSYDRNIFYNKKNIDHYYEYYIFFFNDLDSVFLVQVCFNSMKT